MADQDYTPELVGSGSGFPLRAKVLIEVERCGACERPMLPELGPLSPRSVFNKVAAQAKRAGWPMLGTVKNGAGEAICQDCERADKATFTCALCGEERPTSQIKERYGDPADYLCVPCYETVPAKVWAAKDEELHDAHRYDYE